ncbi:UNVERIFIED_CONTAM: hypothetical protein Sradi_4265200 [Sesamum radiatum]|uniref:Uncharacterized protein n=1 Tax=Sesamum radiatum TaxID=300843 RepID=A0AAW2P7J9_SESRA
MENNITHPRFFGISSSADRGTTASSLSPDHMMMMASSLYNSGNLDGFVGFKSPEIHFPAAEVRDHEGRLILMVIIVRRNHQLGTAGRRRVKRKSESPDLLSKQEAKWTYLMMATGGESMARKQSRTTNFLEVTTVAHTRDAM